MPRDNRVYKFSMSFVLLDGSWHLQFLQLDSKSSLPVNLTFADPAKIRDLAEQGRALRTPEARRTLEHAIEMGRGRVLIKLTRVQYSKMSEPEADPPAEAG
jgi:hypothetical protein